MHLKHKAELRICSDECVTNAVNTLKGDAESGDSGESLTESLEVQVRTKLVRFRDARMHL